MTGPVLYYSTRLIALALAGGLLMYVAASLLAAVIAGPLLRRIEMAGAGLANPERARAWLMGLRLLPLWLSVMVVGGTLVPSFVWLETPGVRERVDWLFVAFAALGAAVTLRGFSTAARALWRSAAFAHRTRRAATPLPGESAVWVVPGHAPLLALAGVFCPRLLISQAVLDRLSPKQLRAALRHERAHQNAHDNLKRLLLLAAPALVARGAQRRMEAMWGRLTEWCADDRAVAAADASDPNPTDRSLNLAAALVEVASLSAYGPLACGLAVSPLAGNDRDLATRVERLLSGRLPPAMHRQTHWATLGGLLLLAWCMLQPTTLTAAHVVCEHLLR